MYRKNRFKIYYS